MNNANKIPPMKAARQDNMLFALSEKVGEQRGVIVMQKEKIAWLRASMAAFRSQVAEPGQVIGGMQRHVPVLTHVFTWSTDSAWSSKMSLPFEFADGVVGYGSDAKATDRIYTH